MMDLPTIDCQAFEFSHETFITTNSGELNLSTEANSRSVNQYVLTFMKLQGSQDPASGLCPESYRYIFRFL